MNIKELKEKLNEFPDDMEVVINYYEGEFINNYYHHFTDISVSSLDYYDYSIRGNHYEYYSDEITEEFKTPEGVVVVHPEERNVVLIEVDN
jgi:hypothetical protein